MKRTLFSKDWYFNGEKVDLPHDFAIGRRRTPDAPGGPANGFFNGGAGTYIKYYTFQEDLRYILQIDGAYMVSQTFVNDDLMCTHPHGYAPFLVDITPKVRLGRLNKIKITTDDMQPSSRWYAGAGIYRDVYLWTGGKVRVEPWDIFITTLDIGDGKALVCVSYSVSSDIDGKVRLQATVIGTDSVAAKEFEVRAGQKTAVKLLLTVPEARLWDTDDPYMYVLHTQLHLNGELSDSDETSFGIRTLSLDTENGLLLNGRPIKLRGGCLHNDHGALGTAEYPDAVARKLRLLKRAGFNAIRSAHNPPSLTMLETCDKMGILLMDESFDVWNMQKARFDYHLWFEKDWKNVSAAMVRRDRNHPCVISYSIGNEIIERDCSSNGAAISKAIAEEIRKYDNTRPVTGAVCCFWETGDVMDPVEYKRERFPHYPDFDADWADKTEDWFAPLDIAGYNYLWQRVEGDHKCFPNRIIWHSETHALTFYDSWKTVMDNAYVIGDFTWTAYDNLGEAGAGRACWQRDGSIRGISMADYPFRSCYQGDLDLCGYRRPQSYFRQSIWQPDAELRIFTTHPEHTGEPFTGTGWHWYDVHETWTFDRKYLHSPVRCEVYTTADRVDWYKNGVFTGTSIPEKAVAAIDISYEPGVLEAVAFRGGKETARARLETTAGAEKLTAVPEADTLPADGRGLCYIGIEAHDADGRLVVEARDEVRVLVTGAELLCVFSGDPCNEDEYTSDTCHLFEGRALAVLRLPEDARGSGTRVVVTSPSLASAHAVI